MLCLSQRQQTMIACMSAQKGERQSKSVIVEEKREPIDCKGIARCVGSNDEIPDSKILLPHSTTDSSAPNKGLHAVSK